MAEKVERGAHHLRLAAQAVRVLHAVVAFQVRAADRAVLQEREVDGGEVVLDAEADQVRVITGDIRDSVAVAEAMPYAEPLLLIADGVSFVTSRTALLEMLRHAAERELPEREQVPAPEEVLPRPLGLLGDVDLARDGDGAIAAHREVLEQPHVHGTVGRRVADRESELALCLLRQRPGRRGRPAHAHPPAPPCLIFFDFKKGIRT